MSEELIKKLTNLIKNQTRDNVRVINNTLLINNVPIKSLSKSNQLKSSNYKFR